LPEKVPEIKTLAYFAAALGIKKFIARDSYSQHFIFFVIYELAA
jgi:hypothetical protein